VSTFNVCAGIFPIRCTVAALKLRNPSAARKCHLDTPDIVRQIRCESREAVIHEIKQWLARMADAGGDRVSRQLLMKYEADPESISNFNANVFPASASY